MKGSRLFKLISVMLSVMLVFSLFPAQALAEAGGNGNGNGDGTPAPKEYTVSFYDSDGTFMSSDTVVEGGSAKAPTPLVHEGFVFDGWDKDFSNVTEDLDVTATYVAAGDEQLGLMMAESVVISNTIDIYFFNKDGSFLAHYQMTGLTNDEISAYQLLSKADLINELDGDSGQNFLDKPSEFKNSDFINNGGIQVTGSSPNYVVNATLNDNFKTTFTVKFVDEAGVAIIPAESHDGYVGQTVTASDYLKTFTGYTFISATPTSLILMFTGNVITLKYSLTYNIFYNLDGGVNDPSNPSTYTKVSPTINLLPPTRSGYTFDKWTPSSSIPTGSTGDMTFTATWIPITYSVTYSANNGTGFVPTDSFGYMAGSTVTVKFSPLPSRTGYDFKGWATSSSATAPDYTSGGTTSFAMGTQNVTLYAVWALHNYSVSYNANGGTGSVPSDSSTYTMGSTVTVMFSPAPTRTGYDFKGWSMSSSATVADYTSSGTDSFLMGTEDVTLYAVWALHGFSVFYDANGGTGSVPTDSSSYTMGSPVTVLFDPLPTRTGYDFLGWATSSSATAAQYTATGIYEFAMGSEDVTLYAVWALHDYSVLYDANNGSGSVPVDSSTYNMGDTVTVLFSTLPTRTGYDFLGWATSSSALVAAYTSGGTESFEMGSEDVTLYAVWGLHDYSVTYNANGGSGSVPTDAHTYTMGSTVPVKFDTLPTLTGYDFLGWATSDSALAAAYTSGGTESFEMGSEDVTLYAVWGMHDYSVTYSANGGSGSVPVDSNTYNMGETVTALFDALPTRDGYDFKGWSTSASASAADYTAAGTKTFLMGSEDVTLYAVWAVHHYTISYVLNDSVSFPASNGSNPTSYTILDATINLANPTRPGYTFDHWDPAGTIAQGSTGNQTFTAYWTANSYTITYVLNGGTNDTDNPTGYKTDSPTINLKPATRLGYTFLGWYVGSTPSSTIPTGSTGNKTFTAKWSIITYPITYDLNGGYNTIASYFNPSSYKVTSATITLKAPARLGYTFAGWTPEGVIPTGSTGAKSFVANWTLNTYDINYMLYGGTNDSRNPSTYTVDTPTFSLYAPTRAGYNFLFWLPISTVPQGTAAIVGDLTFYAIWSRPINYSITYTLNGGTNDPSNPSSYNVTSGLITLADPTRDGYTFEGWTPTNNIPAGSTGNQAFTATWKAIDYTITYDLVGGVNNAANPDTYTIETPTFTLADPTRDYYTFAGWEPADTTIEQGSTGNLSFKATWTPITYTITYNLAGGVNAATNPATYTVETDTFTLADPTRAGYNFTGWTPADTTIETGSNGNLVFTATWSAPIVYDIVYVMNGGTNDVANPATYTVESPAITLVAPTRLGYTFLGWTPTDNIPAGSTGTQTFTATWSAPIVYPITYTMNGGVNAGANPATYTVESPAITLAAPTRAGYLFLGWTPTNNIPAGSTGARAFTATWSAPIVYNITYVMNGGTNSVANPATYTVVSGLIALDDPTRAGYDFLGWTPTDNIPAGSIGDRTFTATWSNVHTHTVTYFVTGGTQAGLDGATPFAVYNNVAFGAAVPQPNNPSQDGYTFDGWTTAIPATMPDGDVTIYGTLTLQPVRQEIIPEEQTPLAGPTWSLLNLILAIATVLGIASIFSMLNKKRSEKLTKKNKAFSLSSLIPAAGAVVAFLLTQNLTGSMVFTDRWTILMAGITVVQAFVVAMGLTGTKKV